MPPPPGIGHPVKEDYVAKKKFDEFPGRVTLVLHGSALYNFLRFLLKLESELSDIRNKIIAALDAKYFKRVNKL